MGPQLAMEGGSWLFPVTQWCFKKGKRTEWTCLDCCREVPCAWGLVGFESKHSTCLTGMRSELLALKSRIGRVGPCGGEYRRRGTGARARVPSHMAYHPSSSRMFIADTGNNRIVWLDVNSGEPGTPISITLIWAQYKKWVNAIWDVWIPEVEMVLPSGMLIMETPFL